MDGTGEIVVKSVQSIAEPEPAICYTEDVIVKTVGLEMTVAKLVLIIALIVRII